MECKHEHPLDARSRGLSFVEEMAEKDGVYKTKVDLCRFQLTVEPRVHHRRVELAVPQPRWTSRERHEEVRVGCIDRPFRGRD